MARLADLHRDERAQVQIVAIVSMMFLILVLAFPYNVGKINSRRMRLQNAADAAAYSAAVIQADGLSAINWINSTESYLYHKEIQYVVWFCQYGTNAQLVWWTKNDGDSDISSSSGAPKTWYDDRKQDISDHFKNASSTEPDDFFKNDIVKKICPFIKNSSGQRVLEMWIATLRQTAVALADALPDQMRTEAMRTACMNTDANVRMAFFPDSDQLYGSGTSSMTAPVKLEFNPTKSNSFMKFPDWQTSGDSDNPRNSFVERALQIGFQVGASYMTSKFNPLTWDLTNQSIRVYLPSVDCAKVYPTDNDKQWFDVYKGEPRKRDRFAPIPAMNIYPTSFMYDPVYTALATDALECWASDDNDGTGDHDSNKPCGHSHCLHLHPHYYCFSWYDFVPEPVCQHTMIPWIHNTCHEENRECTASWRGWPPCDTVNIHSMPNIIPLSFSFYSHMFNMHFFEYPNTPFGFPDFGGVSMGAYFGGEYPPTSFAFPNTTSQHHCLIECKLCWYNFTGVCPKSKAVHALKYNEILGAEIYKTPLIPYLQSWDDDRLGCSDKSQVRVYLQDLLTDAYASNWGFNVSDDFHKIHRENFCPSTDKTPTVALAADNGHGENMFRWGITVALWWPAAEPLYKAAVFNTNKGMVAVSSAKAGIVMEDPAFYGKWDGVTSFTAKRNYPARLITGTDERYRSSDSVDSAPSSYSATYMKDQFIDPHKKEDRILNGFHTNWAARLIPVDKSAPAVSGKIPLQWVFDTKNLYTWSAMGSRASTTGGTIASKVSAFTASDWQKFAETIGH